MHEELQGDAWLIGRATGHDFARGTSYPDVARETFPREAWLTPRDAGGMGFVLDPHGKIAWARADIGGDSIVAVLTEQVSDAHLAGLRRDGVSYVFAGEKELDLHLLLATLSRDLDVERLLLEGGGTTNGAFLRAGLVDEVSLLVFPFIDGAPGAPSLFDAARDGEDIRAPVTGMDLVGTECLEGGVMWLRYRIHHAARDAA